MSTEQSSLTEELAWELQQERPDAYRIKWLMDDMNADLRAALKQARLKEEDLTKRPLLRQLRLHQRLHETKH